MFTHDIKSVGAKTAWTWAMKIHLELRDDL